MLIPTLFPDNTDISKMNGRNTFSKEVSERTHNSLPTYLFHSRKAHLKQDA